MWYAVSPLDRVGSPGLVATRVRAIRTRSVPAGCVNVHGHLHGTHARSKARQSRRHLNVNVELVGYRPVRLTELAATARALLVGDVEPQKTIGKTMTLATRAAAAGTP